MKTAGRTAYDAKILSRCDSTARLYAENDYKSRIAFNLAIDRNQYGLVPYGAKTLSRHFLSPHHATQRSAFAQSTGRLSRSRARIHSTWIQFSFTFRGRSVPSPHRSQPSWAYLDEVFAPYEVHLHPDAPPRDSVKAFAQWTPRGIVAILL